ncbi:hypothetical protein Agub_g7666 [Astrephomene gubernaculifera]|uniref:Uncharacterized protein n=1 Tax=Astrephomene gubernaculifera TaxID=47775 RepID=A0AAD3DQE1_9CHLO|nr:hypothetical protein Agub_g7666 [Astrephomene gubernaculifera]
MRLHAVTSSHKAVLPYTAYSHQKAVAPCRRARLHPARSSGRLLCNSIAPDAERDVGPTTATGTNPSWPPSTVSSGTVPVGWPALQPPFSYHASAEEAQSNQVPTGLSPIWKVLLLSDGSVTRHLQLLSGSPVTVECLSMRNVGWSTEGLPPGTELIPGPRVQRQVLLRCQPSPNHASASPTSSPAAEVGSGNGCSGTSGSAGPANHGGGSCVSKGGSSHAPSCCSGGGAVTGTASSNSSSNGNSHTASHTASNNVGAGARCGSSGADSSGSNSQNNPAASSSKDAPAGIPLVYASSWWNAATVDEYLRDRSQPIWMSLSQGHVELYREVHALFRGHSRTRASTQQGPEGAPRTDAAQGTHSPRGCSSGSAAAGGVAAVGSSQLGAPDGMEEGSLEALLGCEGPFWGRQYIFWSGGKPLTLIYEVFSPRLQEYLGPMHMQAE